MDKLKVARVENVVVDKQEDPQPDPNHIPRRQRLTGTLHLTPHHLIFSPNTTSASTDEIWISYPSITLMTRLPQTIQGLYPVQIRTRLFDTYLLYFEKDRQGGAEDVWQSVKDCAVISSVEQLYGFDYRSSKSSDGWSLYNPRSEFSRQGLGSRTKAWRFTDINKDYTFCPTYPSKLVVPSRISDSVLAYAVKYRSKGRIPALAYLHWANHASITRSSQPMVGLKNARSAQDERLVECIFTAHHFLDTAYNPTAETHVYGATATNLIIDARPTTNAMANVAMGAGTENMDNYRTGKKAYLGIDNIHVMRNSLKMVAEAIYEVEQNPSATLDRSLLRKSNWLRHISTLLDGALVIVKNIHLYASHVLIHCSDGWDRTSQLSATAQICLDPYYRTIDGLCVLIEKDWLSFGHKFLDRSGHLSSEKIFTVADAPDDDSDDELGGASKAAQAFFASMQKQFTSKDHSKEVSPVFHQFLDSVWQIMRQFPERFEYNEDLLLKLFKELYSCQFGTFMFNNERERRVSVSTPYTERTVSLWDDLLHDRAKWINPDFKPDLDIHSRETDQGVLLPDPKDVKFWFRLFKRGDEEMNGSGVAFQAEGVEILGPVGPGQVDPVQAPLTAVAPPSRDSQSGWGWSQLSNGAFSAVQGAARDFRSLGQQAINQIRNEARELETGDSQAARGDSKAAKITEAWPRPNAQKPIRLPSDTNPWAANAPDPALEAATNLSKMSISNRQTSKIDEETAAALGGDRRAWDPLGAM